MKCNYSFKYAYSIGLARPLKAKSGVARPRLKNMVSRGKPSIPGTAHICA